MEKQEDLIKESATIIEEIEDQLDQIISKKRKEIESELEINIEGNRRDAKDKMEKLEQEHSGERESLESYRSALSEFDRDKIEIKAQIKAHLAKAVEYQPQIEDLAAKTIGELKKVMELNDNLEELNMNAVSRVESMKVELQEKVGITPAPDPSLSPPAETKEHKDIQSSLDGEMEKLKKIKELLGKDYFVRKELTEIETNSLPEFVETPADYSPMDKIVEKQVEEKVEKDVTPAKEKEPEPELERDLMVESLDIPAVDLERTLEKFRKSIDAEKGIKLSYFENNKKMILDGQDIFNAIDKDVEEVQKLYDKLSKTQSPKEQFFTKQEIIWHQETLREFMMTTIKVCNKEHAVLPQSTAEVLNIGVITKIFDKVSQENWSNKDYFSSFFKFVSELKGAYLEKTMPKTNHLKSLLAELEIGQ